MQTFIRKRGQGTFMHRKITLFYLGEIFALVNTKTNILFKLTTCDKFFSEETNALVFQFAIPIYSNISCTSLEQLFLQLESKVIETNYI